MPPNPNRQNSDLAFSEQALTQPPYIWWQTYAHAFVHISFVHVTKDISRVATAWPRNKFDDIYTSLEPPPPVIYRNLL